ncbi:MAG: type IV pilus assembly protein PilM [Pseudohongiellaceae bacterium]
MKLFSKKSKTLLGVDISSTAVKLVELHQAGAGWRLENYVIRPLPEKAVQEKNIQDTASVAECVRQAVTLLKPRDRSAAVAVAGSAVITKVIEMNAHLNDSELENQIVVEADQYIPYPLSEVAIDFERQPSDDPDAETVDVLLAACRRENVDSRVQALQEGGLEVNVVDIEAFAMERACGLLESQLDGMPEMLAIVDIGANAVTLYILRNGRTLYTREQLFGGKQLLEQIQLQLSLSPAEADRALRKGELPEEFATDVLPGFREQLVDQINRALQFFFSSSHYNDVDRIVLAGGVAVLEGLAGQLEESTGTAVMVADPFRNVEIGSKVNSAALAADAPALMIASGLALRKRY